MSRGGGPGVSECARRMARFRRPAFGGTERERETRARDSGTDADASTSLTSNYESVPARSRYRAGESESSPVLLAFRWLAGCWRRSNAAVRARTIARYACCCRTPVGLRGVPTLGEDGASSPCALLFLCLFRCSPSVGSLCRRHVYVQMDAAAGWTESQDRQVMVCLPAASGGGGGGGAMQMQQRQQPQSSTSSKHSVDSLELRRLVLVPSGG